MMAFKICIVLTTASKIIYKESPITMGDTLQEQQ